MELIKRSRQCDEFHEERRARQRSFEGTGHDNHLNKTFTEMLWGDTVEIGL